MAQAFAKAWNPGGTGTLSSSAKTSGGCVIDSNRMMFTYMRGTTRWIDIVSADNGWNDPTSNFTSTNVYSDAMTGAPNTGYLTQAQGVWCGMLNATMFYIVYPNTVSNSQYYVAMDVFNIDASNTVTKVATNTNAFGVWYGGYALSNFYAPMGIFKLADNSLIAFYIYQNGTVYTRPITFNTSTKALTIGNAVAQTYPGNGTSYEFWSQPVSDYSTSVSQFVTFRMSSSATFGSFVNYSHGAVNNSTYTVSFPILNGTTNTYDHWIRNYANQIYFPNQGQLTYLDNTAAVKTGSFLNPVTFASADTGSSSAGSIILPINSNFCLLVDRTYFATTTNTKLKFKVIRTTDTNFIDQSTASATTSYGLSVTMPGQFLSLFASGTRPQVTATGDIYWLGWNNDGLGYGFKCIKQPS